MVKEYKKKCLHIDLNMLCGHKVFHEKWTYFVACVKKTKFGAKIRLFTIYFFLVFFCTGHKKYRFSVKSLWEHIECEDVSVNFISEFFDISKFVF